MIASNPGSPDRRAKNVCRAVGSAARFGLLCACAAVLTLGFARTASAQGEGVKKDKKKATKAAPPAKVDPKTPVAPPRLVLVFPPDDKGGISAQLADNVTNVEESRLTASHLYDPVYFIRSIPTIKLGIAESTLTQSEISHPYADSDTKLKKLSGITGYDLVLVSAIEDYQFDPAKNQVSIVMSARLIDYAGAKAVVRSVGSSASSPENAAGNLSELKLAQQTIRGLIEKMMSDLLNPKPTKPAADTK